MDEFRRMLKQNWLFMIEPPWRRPGALMTADYHWLAWILGWQWSVTGLVGGGLVAPSLVRHLGLSNTPYSDATAIGIVALAGFIVQFLGWCLLAPANAKVVEGADSEEGLPITAANLWVVTILFVAMSLPLICVGYLIYRYLIWVGPSQRSVTVAFVGGLLVKTFLIPLIKGLVTGALFKWFIRWLRGDKAKMRGA